MLLLPKISWSVGFLGFGINQLKDKDSKYNQENTLATALSILVIQKQMSPEEIAFSLFLNAESKFLLEADGMQNNN